MLAVKCTALAAVSVLTVGAHSCRRQWRRNSVPARCTSTCKGPPSLCWPATATPLALSRRCSTFSTTTEVGTYSTGSSWWSSSRRPELTGLAARKDYGGEPLRILPEAALSRQLSSSAYPLLRRAMFALNTGGAGGEDTVPLRRPTAGARMLTRGALQAELPCVRQPQAPVPQWLQLAAPPASGTQPARLPLAWRHHVDAACCKRCTTSALQRGEPSIRWHRCAASSLRADLARRCHRRRVCGHAL